MMRPKIIANRKPMSLRILLSVSETDENNSGIGINVKKALTTKPI